MHPRKLLIFFLVVMLSLFFTRTAVAACYFSTTLPKNAVHLSLFYADGGGHWSLNRMHGCHDLLIGSRLI